ncbi:MAG TPA: c-type cytochrome [Urbifossiella sp.]|jgi:mono/diheme cytochrome c family protein|nr:c-type cytochrome [Urbifossiella sp.]
MSAQPFRFMILGAPALFVALFAGCGKSEGDGPGPNAVAEPPTGNAVFDKNCHGCHSVAPDGKAKKKGPNLSKAGATHDAEWLAEHVKNPKIHKPGSNMPEFASKLSAEELKNVAEFMATLK